MHMKKLYIEIRQKQKKKKLLYRDENIYIDVWVAM